MCLAARKGLGCQTYIKMLLREALAKNGGEIDPGTYSALAFENE
jgi:hypothetical protein